jgi:colanic acid/amylovoran biosynthesis glycosyltransferase
MAIFGDWPMLMHDGVYLIPATYRVGMRYGARLKPRMDRISRRLAIDALTAHLRRHRVDIVLAEWAYTAVNIMESCARLGVPLVTHFHGADVYVKEVIDQFSSEYAQLFQTGVAFIYGATIMKPHLIQLGVPEDKLFYNPCGVNIDDFTPTRPQDNPPTFLSVGRFTDKKGPQLTLLAFERVAKMIPDARLIAIGEGHLLEACQQMAKALGLAQRVQYLGGLEHEEVRRILRSGRAFVQHSYTTGNGDSEGTAISVLEACAVGLPVVSTRHGGIQDTIVHGQTGFLVEEMDIGGQAEYMVQLARDPDLAGDMGRKARQRVVEHYSMESSIAGIQRILEFAARSPAPKFRWTSRWGA